VRLLLVEYLHAVLGIEWDTLRHERAGSPQTAAAFVTAGTCRSVSLDDWVTIIIGGLVVLIALDLALVVAISDPFRGPMRVLPTPSEGVLGELEAGRFGAVTFSEDPYTSPDQGHR
jgi:hypothetical protein